MAEETLPSAVSVPQPEPLDPGNISPDASQKRRLSSVSENGNKRRRLSDHQDEHTVDETRQSPPQPTAVAQEVKTARPSRKAATATEERKRGQRLFGGLLGTLSQTSSTAAQRRRADIEQRQQAKLKQQDEQQSEAKRMKKENLVVERRKLQKQIEASSMAIRHKNLLQSANFLRTKVEPVLLWRPYQLRDEDDNIIAKQREEAKHTILKEETEFEERWHQCETEEGNDEGIGNKLNTDEKLAEENREANGQSFEEKAIASRETEQREKDTSTSGSTSKVGESADTEHVHPIHRHDDEGEDIMEEDKEDMVLY